MASVRAPECGSGVASRSDPKAHTIPRVCSHREQTRGSWSRGSGVRATLVVALSQHSTTDEPPLMAESKAIDSAPGEDPNRLVRGARVGVLAAAGTLGVVILIVHGFITAMRENGNPHAAALTWAGEWANFSDDLFVGLLIGAFPAAIAGVIAFGAASRKDSGKVG